MKAHREFAHFVRGSLRIVTTGGKFYWIWLAFLCLLIVLGAIAYAWQLTHGLIITNMRDQVSWAFYIGNFTFLVGVAAAAVVLVIPAYLYHWEPIKEIAILGELLAISATVMCLLFVTVDIGRPERFWHLIPLMGLLNFPQSILAWDVLVLNVYLLLNFFIVTYLLYTAFRCRPYYAKLVWPLIVFSIPMAVSIHTVTAFVYNGMPARPFWNTSILAPRFLCSAFCSGPAILLVLLEILRATTPLKVRDEAVWKIAELMAYAMFINLFLQGADLFKELYSDTHHTLFTDYLLFGLKGHNTVVPYAWASILFGFVAFLLFLVPRTRKRKLTRIIGCLLIYAAVYLEKGMCLVIPGLTPDTLGEIYEYAPTIYEFQVAAGIFSIGFLLFTLMVKVAIAIALGDFTIQTTAGHPRQERRATGTLSVP